MLLTIMSGFKIKSARLCALAFREHEAHLVIHISWKAMIARKNSDFTVPWRKTKTLKCLDPKGKLFF